ncbi:MAG: hypothetical protein LBV69_07210 [Bacteroidales bacterium]|jgi:hypothetical protein|nr:hypothetical protein [Bacteroidales bacterium]
MENNQAKKQEYYTNTNAPINFIYEENETTNFNNEKKEVPFSKQSSSFSKIAIVLTTIGTFVSILSFFPLFESSILLAYLIDFGIVFSVLAIVFSLIAGKKGKKNPERYTKESLQKAKNAGNIGKVSLIIGILGLIIYLYSLIKTVL